MAIPQSVHLQDHARTFFLSKIRNRLLESGKTLEDMIAARGLYFRLSLVGACNLSCEFCHNEGAPTTEKMNIEFATQAMEVAASLGFTRVQFTGGEPLLHPRIADFVKMATQIFPDVGVTTNGTFLNRHIADLVNAKINRIHVSLHTQVLSIPGSDAWKVPNWLIPVLEYARQNKIILRFNLPVPENRLEQTRHFLQKVAHYGCDLKVFSILPTADRNEERYPMEQLADIVAYENARRFVFSQSGRVELRGYRPPSGIRCKTCSDFEDCRETSHSLRLGADRVLRPCLATRRWDSLLTEQNMRSQIEEAALLAIDYQW